MKVIKLTQSSRKEDRAVIYLDNGEVFSIHKDLLLENQIWSGKEIDKDTLIEIQKADLFYKLMDKAMRRLVGRPQSEREIRQSLKEYIYKNKFEVENSVIETLIEKLKDYGLVDDEKFAKYFIQSKSKKKSVYEIGQMLKLKGVRAEVFGKFLENDDLSSKEEDVILKLSEKKLKSLISKNLPKTELKLKILNFLYRKGFPFDISKKTVEKLLDEL